MRKFLGISGFFAALLTAAAAQAACEGRDLIASLPAEARADLAARADSHAYARGNLWHARRGEEVILLVGTYHLPDPRHEATLAQITPLMAGVSQLLVEATPQEEALLKEEIANRPDFMVITEGPRLSEQLTEDEWKKLSKEAQLRGIPAFMADRFRPWYMAVLLGMPPCAMGDLKEGVRGLDHQIMALAEARDIPVRALERYDTLFSIFGELSQEDETEMVRASLLTAERPEDMTVTLANAYFAGESRLVWEFTRDLSAELPGMTPQELDRQFALMEEVLMIRRNQRWIPVLLSAASEGPVLAAFGALHLSGEKGVLALLQAEGFEIRPLAE
ncbi:TraB/GumN family protein [Falsigemmobacter intermedius]|uniref:TraB/GumN family protein n=1 Tax=Falsigemmobacter intermedius TaxID=1553448 RepID=A0A3S3V5R2_9RHOB|nr:TraB/GumN family protein [Falsigemmobacter intermedius]RWY42244.1 TraB/GumN family protein [Falsigemmobacter intermedius]